MSYNLTPERLQEIAVRVVSNFMTKQADLSGSIAAEAKSLELNPEQIKRVIESSNTIAYLRQLEDAKDRAFEFPVAEYRDVMGRMVLPDANPVVDEVKECVPIEVTADKEEVTNSSVSEQEKVAMLFKETMRIKQTLTKMAGEEDIMSLRLEELSSKVQRDPKALEKLAHVCSEETLPLLSMLCGLEKSAATSGSVFTSKELAEVISLDSLFKEARDLLGDIKSKQEFVKRASVILIEKRALLRSMDSPKSIPGAAVEGAGYGIGATARGLGSATVGSAKIVGKGIKSLAKGKTVMQRVTNTADLAGSIGVAADTKHANPVWESIHG